MLMPERQIFYLHEHAAICLRRCKTLDV